MLFSFPVILYAFLALRKYHQSFRFPEEDGTPAVDDQMFEKMVELGSTKGCFAGHDHMNNFSVNYQGIRLTYGLSCDHNIYLVPLRGGVLINVKNDGFFTTQHLIRHRGQSTVTIGKETVNFNKVLNPILISVNISRIDKSVQ